MFGFENFLRFFNLLPTTQQIDPSQVRHTFGFGSLVQRHQENLLSIFGLLAYIRTVRTTHNRQVECGWPPRSSPSGPTILLIFIGFL